MTARRRPWHAALSELGGLDVLVTAFCEREDAAFLSIEEDAWQRALDGNLKAAFLVGRECARAMVASGGGRDRPRGLRRGSPARPGTAAYAAAKAGVHLMTTCMALDLVPDGVRVCAVAACEDGSEAPGPSGLGPEDVAAAVAFCASDARFLRARLDLLPQRPPAGESLRCGCSKPAAAPYELGLSDRLAGR